jgi:3-methyladenine DNA glycosylase AlkD
MSNAASSRSHATATKRYVDEVIGVLEPLADSQRATAMRAYMKDHFSFLGIPSPTRRKAVKTIAKPHPDDVMAIAQLLWDRNEREYQYVAVDLLSSNVRTLEPKSALKLVEKLAVTKSWWDSVDGLASVGSDLLALHPEELATVERWTVHKNMWVNRLAILHQNGLGSNTDADRLFRICLVHANSPEFFIRKAIGWALRDYAWKNPSAVQTFAATHRDVLSPLSVREALKNCGEMIRSTQDNECKPG